jgi:hypothetical protein
LGNQFGGGRKGRGSPDNVLHCDGGQLVTLDGDRPEEWRMGHRAARSLGNARGGGGQAVQGQRRPVCGKVPVGER